MAFVGHSCLLFKRDLKRAYHQFPNDPFDYPLLGYQWNGELYFDVLPMGLKTAAMACQRSTSAVCHMLSQDQDGCFVVNYLDDFIGISSPDKAFHDYDTCGSLLRDLGLQESPSKALPPSRVLTCLGVEVNSLALTLSVTPEWLQELETLLLQWTTQRSAMKSELQSLVGKLLFVTKCVRQSRLFLSRILALLRLLKHNHYHTKLSKEFHRDIRWWLRFLQTYLTMVSQLFLCHSCLFNWLWRNEIVGQEKPEMKLLRGATQEKILGTVWNHAKDMLLFNVNPPNDITLTKRTVLSQIARIFGPVELDSQQPS